MTWEVTLTPKQSEADRLLRNPPTQPFDLLFGGGKGGGKSHYLVLWAFLFVVTVAAKFNLRPRGDGSVKHIGWIGRKRATDFVQTTLQTWQEQIPNDRYEVKTATERHPRHFLIDRRVALDYGGLDSPRVVNQFNSAEYAIIGVDQAEETTRDEVSVLQGSRRLMLDGQELLYLGLWTANPAPGWLKEDFIDYPTENKRFVQALYKDNPHLPPSYIKTLESAFGYRPDLLRAYRDGDWTALSGINQVILQEWIAAAATRMCEQPYKKRLVSVDPARYGNNLAVVLGLENTKLIDSRAMPMCSEPQLVAEAAAMSTRLGNVPIVVEVVGDCGVGDQLMAQGCNVIEYRPAAAASDPEKYCNLRAEVHNTVAKWFSLGVFDQRRGGIVTFSRPEDETLVEAWRRIRDQLTWPTYTFRGQKLLITSKAEIEADHSGVSPDYGDAYVNGVFHLPFVDPYEITHKDVHIDRPNSALERIRKCPAAMA